jgi:hypothetical protein
MAAPAYSRLLSGSELRRLLVLRSRLREEIVGLPRGVQRDVLRALERARQLRLNGQTPPWFPPAMTSAELIREIKWRIDAAALPEMAAGAAVVDRARKRAAIRVRRRSVERNRAD